MWLKKEQSIEAMHHLKDQARLMKEALLKGKLDEIGEILDFGFPPEETDGEGISNPLMEEIYETARKAGATGGKISGAGGGGFMIFTARSIPNMPSSKASSVSGPLPALQDYRAGIDDLDDLTCIPKPNDYAAD